MSAALEVADIAAEQWGLVTSAQARAVGIPSQTMARLATQGTLERISHGVYRVTGSPANALDGLRAAWLSLEPELRAWARFDQASPAVVSYRSAAWIHGLGDLEADTFEFTSSDRKQSRRSDIRLHRGLVRQEHWVVVDGLPVTSVLKTVRDLAAERTDGGHLSRVVRDAIVEKQVDVEQLIEVLSPFARAYGAYGGDGQDLLKRFLRESGVSTSIGRAVELLGSGWSDSRRPHGLQIEHP